MKILPITKGKHILIDDDDLERVSKHKWFFNDRYVVANPYDRKTKKQSHVFLHRFIMNTPKGLVTDHKNSNPLDNRKTNLRICSPSENARHRRKPRLNKNGRPVSSKYKGVHYYTRIKRWSAYIKVDGKEKFLGNFIQEIDAARAYDKTALSLWGDFALINGV